MDDQYRIGDEAALESLLGEPSELAQMKACNALDETMQEFIHRSPLALVSTIDASGHVDISPKGDPRGFVEIDEDGQLLIPERPGNQLTYGFRNILRNGEIGLLFLVPGLRETLRVKGRASLHRDPEVLERMQVKGKPALLYTRVAVAECFFHCGKAMIRSGMWKPESWDTEQEALMVRHFASRLDADNAATREIEEHLEESYSERLY